MQPLITNIAFFLGTYHNKSDQINTFLMVYNTTVLLFIHTDLKMVVEEATMTLVYIFFKISI